MPDTQSVAVLDLGQAYFKAAIYQANSATYQNVAWQIAPRMVPKQTAHALLEQLASQISLNLSDLNQLIWVGDTANLGEPASSVTLRTLSPEEALSPVLKRLSSTNTVAFIDIGSRQTLVGTADYGEVQLQTYPYGVGLEAWNYLRQHQQTDELRRFLPVQISPDELENYLANKSVYPDCLPTTPRELAIEQAMAKLILRQICQEQPFNWVKLDQLILSGAVLAAPSHPAQSAAIILDGLQPTGVLNLLTDPTLSILTAGGFLAHQGDDDYRLGRALLGQLLVPVGTLAWVDPVQNHPAVDIDTGLQTVQRVEPKPDEVILVPLENSVAGTITLAKSDPQPLIGGSLGLVIDSRTRPIILPEKDNDRLARLINWDKELNAHQQIGDLEVNP